MSEGRYHELDNPLPISAAQATASEQAVSPIVGFRVRPIRTAECGAE